MFDTQLIIDADHGRDGWEISVRFDAESQEVGWSDMDDAALRLAVGEGIANVLIAARTNEAGGTRQQIADAIRIAEEALAGDSNDADHDALVLLLEAAKEIQ